MALARFRAEGGAGLERHALFEALSLRMAAEGYGAGWTAWPEAYRDPDGPAARAGIVVRAEPALGADGLCARSRRRAEQVTVVVGVVPREGQSVVGSPVAVVVGTVAALAAHRRRSVAAVDVITIGAGHNAVAIGIESSEVMWWVYWAAAACVTVTVVGAPKVPAE